MARAMIIIIIKYLLVILESPAIKHKTSSGKSGNKNIAVKITLSLPFTFFNHVSSVSFPTIHATARYPKSLPIKNAVTEPKTIAKKLYKKHFTAPKSAVPATSVTKLGMGKIITCKYCRTINKTSIQAPADRRYSLKDSTLFTTVKNPVANKQKNKIKTKSKRKKTDKVNLYTVCLLKK